MFYLVNHDKIKIHRNITQIRSLSRDQEGNEGHASSGQITPLGLFQLIIGVRKKREKKQKKEEEKTKQQTTQKQTT